jgi:hypothetical protein
LIERKKICLVFCQRRKAVAINEWKPTILKKEGLNVALSDELREGLAGIFLWWYGNHKAIQSVLKSMLGRKV